MFAVLAARVDVVRIMVMTLQGLAIPAEWLQVFTEDAQLKPRAGQSIVSELLSNRDIPGGAMKQDW